MTSTGTRFHDEARHSCEEGSELDGDETTKGDILYSSAKESWIV